MNFFIAILCSLSSVARWPSVSPQDTKIGGGDGDGGVVVVCVQSLSKCCGQHYSGKSAAAVQMTNVMAEAGINLQSCRIHTFAS